MMNFQIGYFSETSDGQVWCALKRIKRKTDAEAEAEIDGLFSRTPADIDGNVRAGLYIKRGSVKWFRRFSCHAGKS